MFRKTAVNLKKLKRLAVSLNATILKPYYPASDLYRISQDDTGLQIDFMARLHGVKSFESLKSRAALAYFDGRPIWVADLDDIIRSKRALGRPKDRAVLEILESARDEKKKTK